jgi:hypothetical protein
MAKEFASLPSGFGKLLPQDWQDKDIVWVMVPLTQSEYRRFRNRRNFMARGCVWEAVREAMRRPTTPTLFAKGSHIAIHDDDRFWDTQRERVKPLTKRYQPYTGYSLPTQRDHVQEE